MMMSAVSPQMSAAPQPPRSSTDQPSEPSMKPGFARQMTNPSYQRSVFRSWRSSTTATPTPASPALPQPCLPPSRARIRRQRGRAGERNTFQNEIQYTAPGRARSGAVQSTRWRGRRSRSRASAVRRSGWPTASAGRATRADARGTPSRSRPRSTRASCAACGATRSRCSRSRRSVIAVLVPLDRLREPTLHRSCSARDGRLAVLAPALLAAPVPPHGAQRTALESPPRVVMTDPPATAVRARTSRSVSGGTRPVLLATLDVPFAEDAMVFAVDSAVEAANRSSS